MINASDLITRVRERLHDTGGRVFDAAEILRCADDTLKPMFSRYRNSGEHHGLDRLDVTISSMTAVEQDVLEYEIPEWVADIQKVEAIAQAGVPGWPIVRGNLAEMDIGRGQFTVTGDQRWFFSRYGNQGNLQIRGRMGTVPTIRIWFIRSWGPLHTGVAASGTTTSLTVGTTTGGYKARTGLYGGMQLEVTSDSGGAANVGLIRRITDFTSGVMTLSPALPAAVSATTNYALVVPIPPEHGEYLIEAVTVGLLRRMGSDEEAALRQPYLEALRQDWEWSISVRSSGEPPRMSNSRMYGR